MSQNFMSPTCKCHYCGALYYLAHGHVCQEAERVMRAKLAAERAQITGSTRTARRLAAKAARKAKR